MLPVRHRVKLVCSPLGELLPDRQVPHAWLASFPLRPSRWGRLHAEVELVPPNIVGQIEDY